ncbi:MAG: hypothetical protein H6747_09605 [Deltaproteobacteria bacterium]|nr:hypothetical protein [Deltaproteobacteria bacterium]
MKPSEILTAVQTAIEAIPEPEGVSPDDKLRVASNPSRVRRAGRIVEVGIGGSRQLPGQTPCLKPEHEVYLELAVAYTDSATGMATAADDAAAIAVALLTLPNLHADLVSVQVEVGDISDLDETTLVSTRTCRVVFKYGA